MKLWDSILWDSHSNKHVNYWNTFHEFFCGIFTVTWRKNKRIISLCRKYKSAVIQVNGRTFTLTVLTSVNCSMPSDPLEWRNGREMVKCLVAVQRSLYYQCHYQSVLTTANQFCWRLLSHWPQEGLSVEDQPPACQQVQGGSRRGRWGNPVWSIRREPPPFE